jgi:predicted nucleic acid-binding protein
MSADSGYWYLDTSALAKLVRTETESAALVSWLAPKAWLISDLHRTELRRAALKVGGSTAARAERLIASSDILAIDARIFDLAGELDSSSLRSLDAIHVAAALQLGTDLAGIVAYDDRLLAAAASLGIATASPF